MFAFCWYTLLICGALFFSSTNSLCHHFWQPLPLFSHCTSPSSSMTHFPIISGFPLTFGQRARPLSIFSKWKNISYMCVTFKSQVHFWWQSQFPLQRPVLKPTSDDLLTRLYTPAQSPQPVGGIFFVYSIFINVNWQDNGQCHIKADVTAVLCTPVGRTYLSTQHDLQTNFQSLLNIPDNLLFCH